MTIRLNKVSRNLNISITRAVEFLQNKGYSVANNPNTRITEEQFAILQKEFQNDKDLKQRVNSLDKWRRSVERSRQRNSRQKISSKFRINNDSDTAGTYVAENILDTSKSLQKEVANAIGITDFDPSLLFQKVKGKKKKGNKSNANLNSKKSDDLSKDNSVLKKGQGNNETNVSVKDVRLKVRPFSIKAKKYRSSTCLSVRYKRRLYTRVLDKEELLFYHKKYCGLEVIPLILLGENTFSFNLDISALLSEFKRKQDQSKAADNKPIKKYSAILCANNIEFFDGYYLIWIIQGSHKNRSIMPLRIIDNNSMSCLNLISKYFQERIPKDIIINYNDKEIVSISKPALFGRYVRFLRDGVDVHGDWWEEVQNAIKPTLKKCREQSLPSIKKEMSLKNCYLDYLAGMPNQRKVIKAYEIRENLEEDVFIFTVDVSEGKCIVIFENTSYTATATKIFVVKNNNYEDSINHIFDYFTNYELKYKRLSMKYNLNPPSKFFAEDYYSINHNDPKTWIERLNGFIEREISANKIQFNYGLHISEENNKRTGTSEEVKVKFTHNSIMSQLYHELCIEYGAENVGTENKIGNKKIDVVVRTDKGFDIYEIKSDIDPRNCVREAMGQILDYAYFECKDKIGKMTIVGPTMETREVKNYLAKFREKNNIEIYYRNV